MPEHIINVTKHCWIIVDSAFKSDINSQWFDDQYWLNQGRLLGASSGRGSAWMVKTGNSKMMLRHYYRGGIPAKLIKDKYFWTGLENTRGFSEFRLLNRMIELDLPVPRPIAAQVSKKGFFYRANILIEYLSHQNTFAQLLNTSSDTAVWAKLGRVIAQFHQQGINHADLNANNILVGDPDIYLIDFDHSRQTTPRKIWQQSNLSRLKRSIDKISKEQFKAHNNIQWQHLLRAYQAAMNA